MRLLIWSLCSLFWQWKCAKSWSSQGTSACRQTYQVVMYVPGHGQQGFLRNVFAVIGGRVVEISFLAPGLTLNSRPHTFMEPQNQPPSTINIGLLHKYSTADHRPGTHIPGESTSTTNCHQVSSISDHIAITLQNLQMSTLKCFAFPSTSKSHPRPSWPQCSWVLLLLICRRSLISTEGALRLPTTYDNHPIQPIPSHPQIAVKTTSPLKM